MDDQHIEIFGANYCGHYSEARSTCRGIIVDKGRILLSYETKTDHWMTPGGGVENEESDTECVKREIEEETGYLVEPLLFALQIDEYYGSHLFSGRYFICQVIGMGKRRLTDTEIKVGLEPRWVPLEEAISIFGGYRKFTSIDEMRAGLYLREFTALERIKALKLL